MAESISEGTLKTWLKQVSDTVQADEEVATIETDKVCVRVLPRNLSCICVVACASAPTPKHIYPTLTLHAVCVRIYPRASHPWLLAIEATISCHLSEPPIPGRTCVMAMVKWFVHSLWCCRYLHALARTP